MPGRKLTAAFVRSVKRAGKYGDQHGLILRVRRTGSKQWIWRGTVGGRRVDLGLGGYPYTSLREARDRAFEYRRAARSGRHPKALSGSVPTFSEAVERVIEMHRASWRPGSGSEEEWRRTLRLYAIPRLGAMLVSEISTADIMAVLQPIWGAKAVTARRVRQRIGAVMRWTIAQGYRGDNPAGDAVTAALPRNAAPAEHFRALPHSEVPAVLAKVRQSDAGPIARLSLEFLVLTAARAGEVRHARWAEIDHDGRLWTIPASRMKARREHRVPLARGALEVLQEAESLGDGSPLIFPSSHTGRTLSSGVWWKLLRRLDLDCTVHGFRSSFRDWCGESGVPREVAEACLAHAIGNQAEAAYARSDLLERRRLVMEEWDQYATG
ncbi:MAG: tyrosine-type recombinase/integrase [Acidobacteria bacterium]|nr:tyrosine-type recombinase/integrase [Acidobacteriota bacterium]